MEQEILSLYLIDTPAAGRPKGLASRPGDSCLTDQLLDQTT